jgi:hypothetical protein
MLVCTINFRGKFQTTKGARLTIVQALRKKDMRTDMSVRMSAFHPSTCNNIHYLTLTPLNTYALFPLRQPHLPERAELKSLFC